MRSPSELSIADAVIGQRCRQLARGAGFLVVLIGLAVLTGWMLHIGVLMRVLPGSVSMKPNTALGFCLAGASLFLFVWEPAVPNRWTRKLAAGLAVLLLMVAGLTVWEYAAGFNSGIDEFIFRDLWAGRAASGRMAPITAFNFVAVSFALLCLCSPRRAAWIHLLTGLVAFSSLLAILGYFYAVPSLYEPGHFTAVALHTAIAFWILCIGLWCATSHYGFMRLVTGEGTSSMLDAPRYGLVVMVLPFFLDAMELRRGASRMVWPSVWHGVFFDAQCRHPGSLSSGMERSLSGWPNARKRWRGKACGKRIWSLNSGSNSGRPSSLPPMPAWKRKSSNGRKPERANQQILDNSLDVICTFDSAGRFLQVSRACEAVWGYRPDQLIGRSYIDLVHPDDRTITATVEAEILDGTPATNFENRYLRRDGSTVHMLWTSKWSEGQQTNFCVARDLTERKRTEESMRLLESAVEQANESIMITDAELDLPGPRIVFVNSAYCR